MNRDDRRSKRSSRSAAELPIHRDKREFLRRAALATGGLALGGAALESGAADGPTLRWDEEADVVIVGYGFAGVSAAITAHDAGAKVLILEKAPEQYRGGNSRVSGNGVFWPNDVEKAKTYFRAMCGPYMDNISDEMVQVWANEMYANRAWLEKMGWTPVQYDGPEFPDLPGADCGGTYMNGKGIPGDNTLWEHVTEPAMLKRNIRTLYETPAISLIRRGREVIGVSAERSGQRINIKAKRAVILTCGGFENDPAMVRNYVNDMPTSAPAGTPYNTGDGIRMGLEVGADLWHMNNVSGPTYLFRAPELQVSTWFNMPTPNFIIVARDGNRFIAENGPNDTSDHGKVLRFGRWIQVPCPVPINLIFDETLRRAGGIGGKPAGQFMGWDHRFGIYDWSSDNLREVDKGWIKKGATIRELATAVHLNPDALEATVVRYNGFAHAHHDADFGRGPGGSLGPIEMPPFYAMELTPTFYNTQGGPRRNKEAQIVDVHSVPIPRLYSAGELGSIYPFQYNGGGNTAECFAFGRIAGLGACRSTPWVE